MKITGKNLQLVIEGLEGAIADIHNSIATCPDVIEFAERIEELETQQREFQQLLNRCRKSLAREGTSP